MRKRRMGLETPCSARAGHDIEIIHLDPVRCCAGMVATWHQNHIMIGGRHGFIKALVIREHPLDTKAIGWVEAVVIGFFQIGQIWVVIFVMTMRRVG